MASESEIESSCVAKNCLSVNIAGCVCMSGFGNGSAPPNLLGNLFKDGGIEDTFFSWKSIYLNEIKRGKSI